MTNKNSKRLEERRVELIRNIVNKRKLRKARWDKFIDDALDGKFDAVDQWLPDESLLNELRSEAIRNYFRKRT